LPRSPGKTSFAAWKRLPSPRKQRVALVRDRERQQEGDRGGEGRREGDEAGGRSAELEQEAPRTSPERERTEQVVKSEEKRKTLEQHAERLAGVSNYLAKRKQDRERGGGGREH
jgi:hypothetical protein